MANQVEQQSNENKGRKKEVKTAAVAAVAAVPFYILIWQLFIAFTRANIFAFGGGPSAIPLIQQEVVDHYKWLTTEEFTDALAMGNSLPGPIATKMSAYVGYKMAGFLGAAAALAGTVLPTAIAMVGLAGIYMKYKDTPQMAGMLKAVRPVVVVLLIQVAWEMGLKSFPIPVTWVIALVAFVLLFYFKVHPIFLIVVSMLFGYFFLTN